MEWSYLCRVFINLGHIDLQPQEVVLIQSCLLDCAVIAVVYVHRCLFDYAVFVFKNTLVSPATLCSVAGAFCYFMHFLWRYFVLHLHFDSNSFLLFRLEDWSAFIIYVIFFG